MRVRDSSQNTYASGLHCYVKFWTDAGGKSLQQILPEDSGMPMADIHLFLGWACSKYKYATLESTISSLIHWHKEKGVPHTALSSPVTRQLLNTIKAEQGPAGMPTGKVGMSRPMLRLLLKHIHDRRTTDAPLSTLYLRDICWTLLGYFGMLRRSELIAMRLGDLQVGELTRGSGSFIEITIRRSKNDRRGEGAVVTVVGETKDRIKIAQLLQEYVAVRL
jgi:hypothetical protein